MGSEKFTSNPRIISYTIISRVSGIPRDCWSERDIVGGTNVEKVRRKKEESCSLGSSYGNCFSAIGVTSSLAGGKVSFPKKGLKAREGTALSNS